MRPLNKPLFAVSLLVFVLALLVDLGANHLLGSTLGAAANANAEIEAKLTSMDLSDGERADMRSELQRMQHNAKPPGLAVSYLGLLDGLVVFTVGSLGLGLLLRERRHAKVQGIITLIAGILVLLGSIGLLLAAFVKLLVMVSLFMAAPFGTLAYLALYGFFDRGGAAVALSTSLVLDIVGLVLLIVAQRRFLGMKSLMLLVLTALGGNVLTSFLHGLVPIVLVSITDAIAAIVIAVLALIWSLVLVVGGIIALVKLIL